MTSSWNHKKRFQCYRPVCSLQRDSDATLWLCCVCVFVNWMGYHCIAATSHRLRRLNLPANLVFVQQLVQTNNIWKHQRSALLALFEGNPPVTSGLTDKGTIMRKMFPDLDVSMHGESEALSSMTTRCRLLVRIFWIRCRSSLTCVPYTLVVWVMI